MDSNSSNLVMLLFDEAAELDPPSRAEFLDRRCGDIALRREVESLLHAYEDAEGFLDERPRLNRITRDPEPHQSGTRIGNYELLDLLGEGGFARVFRARQTHPVRRDVAIKIIKLGMDTRAVIARFELERQALAMMDHPGIAAVYDAGATDVGRPYFVMELVRGERITRFADDANLDVAARARLFIDVCNAVHHAHQKGILHRDLKPSNILVTTVDGQPQPKIIDFGIAKATQGNITDATFMTAEQQMIGTPRYMSPEQAISGGADVDTRSDIYSLGTVLYELMTGAPPAANESSKSGPSGVLSDLRRLRGDQAPVQSPSSRVDGARRRDLRGELDWIILKCLNHDRALRYESVVALAADLQAHLDHRPIVAAPPRALYRIKKFVRRNALAVSAAAIVAVALIAGSIVSTAQAIRATRAEHLAQRRLDEIKSASENLEAVNQFLTSDLIGSAAPAITRGRELTVREAVDNAAAALATKFADRPLTEVVVRDSIAGVYEMLGRPELALPHVQESLEKRRRLLGPDHPQTSVAMNNYALVLRRLGRPAEAEPLLKEAMQTSSRLQGDEHLDTIQARHNYAGVLKDLGRFAEAEVLAKRAWEQSERALGADDYKTITSQGNYAGMLDDLGRPAEAEPIYKDALERSRRVNGEDHPLTLSLLHNYAFALTALGQLAAAEPLYEQVLQLRRRVLGEDHAETINAMSNHAGLLSKLGRHTEAEPIERDALERSRRARGAEHPQTIRLLGEYGNTLRLLKRPADAEPCIRQALELHRKVLGDDHPDTITLRANYAVVLSALGRHEESATIHRHVLEQRRRLLDELHPQVLGALHNYSSALKSLSRNSEAEPVYLELYQKAPRAQIAPKLVPFFMAGYGPCLVRLGRYADAEPFLLEARRRLRDTKQDDNPKMREVLTALAEVYDHTNRPTEAAALRAEIKSIPTSAPAATQRAR